MTEVGLGLVVCAATCASICTSGCIMCIADGPVIIADVVTTTPSLATGTTIRPQD